MKLELKYEYIIEKMEFDYSEVDCEDGCEDACFNDWVYKNTSKNYADYLSHKAIEEIGVFDTYKEAYYKVQELSKLNKEKNIFYSVTFNGWLVDEDGDKIESLNPFIDCAVYPNFRIIEDNPRINIDFAIQPLLEVDVDFEEDRL